MDDHRRTTETSGDVGSTEPAGTGRRVDRLGTWVAGRYRGRHPAVPVLALVVPTTGVLVGLLTIVPLAVAGLPAVADPLRSADRHIVASFADLDVPGLAALLQGLSSTTNTWTVLGVGLGSLSVLGVLRRWPAFTILVVATGVELAVFLTVAVLVARPRPDVAPDVVPITGSYPSGHAAMAIALYGGLALALGSLERDRTFRRTTVIVAAILAVGVGASRLHLGLHYPSDVLAGYLLGGASLTAGVVAARAVVVHDAHRPPARRRGPA